MGMNNFWFSKSGKVCLRLSAIRGLVRNEHVQGSPETWTVNMGDDDCSTMSDEDGQELWAFLWRTSNALLTDKGVMV